MVEAANSAVRYHPHWRRELARFQPRLGRSKAVVVIARKLLVAVWHVRHLPKGQTSLQYIRQQLDRLDLGHDLTHVPWGSKTFKLSPLSRASLGTAEA